VIAATVVIVIKVLIVAVTKQKTARRKRNSEGWKKLARMAMIRVQRCCD